MSIQITEPVNSTPVTDLMKGWCKGLEVHVPQSLPGFSLDVVPYSDYFEDDEDED
ncbi:hypothetical protein [Vibrio phage vB_VmeM-Yong XC32]|nr:hypothetical protein [Vibrio phage vB_VmeM-Yong XC31]QAX96371.1 hypothetical protein [Vibrio phage vB_VmeM-Yong XC32]QAX96689.1 hypothetical protein [Vibrio phage vB_VmeM-Yong MS31]QAX97007.1 hypothetical protein [Vibrio phage vB_VmeM-Yong MS32]